MIAMALALAAYRLSWLERPFGDVGGVLYTIPSLALFQILVPFLGLDADERRGRPRRATRC